MRIEVDLFPFVVEALGNNKKIYKDIDKLYQSNKYEFYNAAKEHKLYTHQILTEGSILQEEYCKKVLGILLVANYKEEISIDIDRIVHKGYTWTYTYVNNHKTIRIVDYYNSFIKKFGGPFDNHRIPIDYHSIILLFWSRITQREIIQDDFYNDYIASLRRRWDHYNDTYKTRIDLKKANEIEKEKIKQLKWAIYRKYGQIEDFNSILNGNFEKKLLDLSAYLFDYENISSLSIFEDVKFTNNDIDEILYLYVLSNEKLRKYPEQDDTEDIKDIRNLIDNSMIEDATKFLISQMYVKYLIKAYKQVKEMYFKNNKETMFVELEELEKSLNSTTEKLFLAKQEINELQQQLEAREKENRRLKAELEEERKSRNELNSLREFMFSLDRQVEFTQVKISPDVLKECKGVIVGGHEKWQQRMKELLPNFIFIHPDNMNFDTRILDGIKILFVYVNYLNHALYYRVMSSIEGKNIKVAYLNQQNEDMVLKNIYKEIKALE